MGIKLQDGDQIDDRFGCRILACRLVGERSVVTALMGLTMS